MRIVSGFLGGRTFAPSIDFQARPTKDLAKESIFNILNNHFDYETLHTLDLFGGTGSITYEFVSRGVKFATIVDNEAKCVKFIKETVDKFNISDNVIIIKNDVFRYIETSKSKYDIIFVDPPYDLKQINTIPKLVFERKILKEDAWLIIEHPESVNFEMKEYIFDKRKYGKSFFTFFKQS